jgi:hypothetical protein
MAYGVDFDFFTDSDFDNRGGTHVPALIQTEI